MGKRDYFLKNYGMVGNEGFEPPMPDSESGALPLGEFPVDFIMRFKGSYPTGFSLPNAGLPSPTLTTSRRLNNLVRRGLYEKNRDTQIFL